MIHYCTFFYKIESVFVVRFTYDGKVEEEDQLLSCPSDLAYEHLSRIDVAPSFPGSTKETPAGVICQHVTKNLRDLLQNPSSTMADLFQLSTGGSVPPGFLLLVRYVDRLSIERGITVEVSIECLTHCHLLA